MNGIFFLNLPQFKIFIECDINIVQRLALTFGINICECTTQGKSCKIIKSM